MEHFSDTPLWHRLLALPKNIEERLARNDHITYQFSSSVIKIKFFIELTPVANAIKLFSSSLMKR